MLFSRKEKIDIFYHHLNLVIKKFPKRTLNAITKDILPEKGVFFFFEKAETRHKSHENRVVRIGLHAAIANSKATLFDRMFNHKGSKKLTGNHRGSVFRKLIGISLIQKDKLNFPHWEDKSKMNDKIVKDLEKGLEILVSEYLYTFEFIVLEIPGPSSKENDRAFIEDNSIALLSNYDRPSIDKCLKNWLGLYSKDDKVIGFGLWNSDCVEQKEIHPNFLNKFEYYF